MPNHPCDFEIPDDWIAEAGFFSFTPHAKAYHFVGSPELVPLNEIEPPFRTRPMDGHGFVRCRLVGLLRGFLQKAEIEAVPLLRLDEVRGHPPPYKFRVRDGYHRFYASIAAGFTHLPGDVV